MISKAVIVDDEKRGIDSLAWEINRLDYPIEIIKTFTKPQLALEFLQEEKIDLLFLDIQMPKLTGFELLNELKEINFSVIFVTSYDEYAIKAFRYSALDYLLKPVEQEELKASLERYTQDIVSSNTSQLDEQLQIHAFSNKGELPNKVAFATKETIEFIRPKDILYCEAVRNYTTIYLLSGKMLVSKTLKEVEAILTDYKFIRVHRSFIINPFFITRYVKTLGGSIIMEDGFEVPISRTKKEAVTRLLFNK